MDELKRITPEQVLAAYQGFGWVPMRFVWHRDNGYRICACGLTAVLGRAPEVPYTLNVADDLGLDHKYAEGFVDGFDGTYSIGQAGKYHRGHQDGRAAWQAVKHLAQK